MKERTLLYHQQSIQISGQFLIRYTASTFTKKPPDRIVGGFHNNSFFYVIYHVIYCDILQVLLYDVMAKPIRTNVLNLSIFHDHLNSYGEKKDDRLFTIY